MKESKIRLYKKKREYTIPEDKEKQKQKTSQNIAILHQPIQVPPQTTHRDRGST